MKYLLSILILSASAQTVVPMEIDMIDEVRSFEHNPITGEVLVTFWGNSKTYQMDEEHSAVTCLSNAYKAKEQVALNFDQNNQIIVGCESLTELEQRNL